MSTATAEYVCEVCDTPLKYKGGPHRPRWCAVHRDSEEHKAQRTRQVVYSRKAKTVGRKVLCTACECRLLTASPDGLCGFCQVELGHATEEDLLKRSADLCASMDS